MAKNNQESKEVGFPLLLLIIGVTLSGLFVFGFAQIAEDLLSQEIKNFDSTIIDYFKSIANPTLDSMMVIITELGSVWFLTTLSVLLVMYLFFKVKDKWGALFFILAIGIGGLLTRLLKNFYERGRPSINEEIDAIGYSFPSGHSMGSLIFYGFIIYLVIRRANSNAVKWIASIFATMLFMLIGISRIYLGAHFPSDVLAGQLAGAVWLIICILALEWVEWQSQNTVKPIRSVRRFFTKLLE